jgi:hypothetical protein
MSNVTTNLPGADQFVLQSTIGAYTDEAYTNAKKLTGTAIVGDNPMISTDTETFIGQMRWMKPLNPVVNNASLTDATDGQKTSYSSDYATYVKAARTHGAEKVNLQSLVTGQDGLAKISRDFSETRTQDEHNALLSILKGVAISEALLGAGNASGQVGLGGQTFDNDPKSKRNGFYVDLGSAKSIVDATSAIQGAARAENFLKAFGMAYKDYEPEFAYLVTSPETMASLRSANLVDSTTVTEGNVTFSTIFGGKFRLIQTRASQGMSTAELAKVNGGGGVDIVGTKTSFIVLPGSLAMRSLAVPDAVEITRDGNKYKGGGVTSIWYRWGFVMHPAGYSWAGNQEDFASDAAYKSAIVAGAPVALTAVSDPTAASGTWTRKTDSVLSLGILPVFHS